MLYVDTSVLVAALTNEPRTGEMQEWLAGQPAGQLAVSDWVMTEFSAALSVKLRTGQLEPAHRADAMAVFADLVEASFEVLPVSSLDPHRRALRGPVHHRAARRRRSAPGRRIQPWRQGAHPGSDSGHGGGGVGR